MEHPTAPSRLLLVELFHPVIKRLSKPLDNEKMRRYLLTPSSLDDKAIEVRLPPAGAFRAQMVQWMLFGGAQASDGTWTWRLASLTVLRGQKGVSVIIARCSEHRTKRRTKRRPEPVCSLRDGDAVLSPFERAASDLVRTEVRVGVREADGAILLDVNESHPWTAGRALFQTQTPTAPSAGTSAAVADPPIRLPTWSVVDRPAIRQRPLPTPRRHDAIKRRLRAVYERKFGGSVHDQQDRVASLNYLLDLVDDSRQFEYRLYTVGGTDLLPEDVPEDWTPLVSPDSEYMALLPVTFKDRGFLLWEDTRYGHATYVFECPQRGDGSLANFTEQLWEEVWRATRHAIRSSPTLGFLDRANHTRFKTWKERVDTIFLSACRSGSNHGGRVKRRLKWR